MLEIGRALRPGVGPSGPQKFFPTWIILWQMWNADSLDK